MKSGSRLLSSAVSVLLAAIMMIALAAPAFAQTPASYNPAANITVGKTITATEPNKFPDITSVDFTLTPVGYNGKPETGTAYTAANLPMPNGASGGTATITVGGFNTANTTTEPVDTTTSKTRTATSQNITYTQTGVYTYSLQEVAGTVQGVVYDPALYYVNVYVTNVLNADGTPVLNTDGTPVVNVSAITAWETNNGATDPMAQDNGGNGPIASTPGVADDGKIAITKPADGDGAVRNISYPFLNKYNTATVVVTKTVTGDLADPKKEFTFQLGLKTAAGAAETLSYQYQVYTYGADKVKDNADDVALTGTGKTGTIGNGGTFDLTHQQYVKIIGVPDGEKVTITEQGATDYKTSINSTFGTVTATSTAETNAKAVAEQTLATGSNVVNEQEFINN